MGLWALSKDDPDRIAVITPDDRAVTAGELVARGNRIAHGLRGLGLKTGDAVATVLPNSAEMLAMHLAAAQTGLYLVPINFHLAAPEIAYIVNDSQAKAVVCHERSRDICEKAATEATAARWYIGAEALAELEAGQPDTPPDDRTAGGGMHYTSGTTGQPKGVRRALSGLDPDVHTELYAMFNSLFGIEPGDGNVHLVVAPLYHTAVMTFATNALHSAHTVVLMDKWTPQATLEAIQRHKVTTSHMVPTMFHRLLAFPDKDRYDVSSLRRMIHSAAPCPPDVKRRMLEWWGPVIWEYYAATEGGGTLVTPEEWLQRPGTVGKSWPTSVVAVRDDEGNDLPPGEIGTVWMSMNGIKFDYHGDAEKTARTWRDDYFTVGDAGYMDEDGYLFLCDRKSDMIISGGVNIYPAEIEAVLLMHPKVGDAGVFGIPHEDWGEEVKAVVEPADGVEASSDLADDIIGFCAERLARFKIPKSIDFHHTLPRDPNGKLYKRKLRDPYWEGRERAI